MIPMLYSIAMVSLLVATFVVFRILVRHDYRQKGRLTRLTGSLELLLWMLFIFLPCIYNPIDWLLAWFGDAPVGPILRIVGWVSLTVGIVLTIAAMTKLGIGKTMGQKTEGLQQTGLYRLSRNPQIVGGGLMIIGCAVLWPSWYALGWVVLYGVIGHVMVLTEEEHLRNVYGEEYTLYCKQIPRYVGVPRSP
jgi:protein-S-isoprenylcysteine O-methyltransferase Ste14